MARILLLMGDSDGLSHLTRKLRAEGHVVFRTMAKADAELVIAAQEIDLFVIESPGAEVSQELIDQMRSIRPLTKIIMAVGEVSTAAIHHLRQLAEVDIAIHKPLRARALNDAMLKLGF